jgi:transcriptional regulator with XRE-family HTH domain
MNPPNPLATNLHELRLSRGWSFDDASRETGFDRDVLEGIERGVTFLSRARIADLAERLGVPADALVR